jgi:DNA-binding transcriptional MocR family regulator
MTNWTPDLQGRVGPRYRVIADAIADDVAGGRLTAGTRLPTHRDLAYTLGVTVGTITRAYAEAEKRGLIGGEVGRGTFVLGQVQPPVVDSPDWPVSVSPSAVILTTILPEQNDAIQALQTTLAELAASNDLASLVTYAPHAGFPAHRAAGAEWMQRWHRLNATPDEVVLATGAQNATAVALGALLRPGDVILTERLTNYGLKVLCPTLSAHLEGIAIDDDGIVPEAFDAACRRTGARLLYTVPTLHNPTATVMSVERRKEIIAIARRFDVTIVEDDVFGFLVDDAVPFRALAPDIAIYLTSLSKSVIAGLRIGYIVASASLVSRLEATARALHYSVPALPAEVASRWIGNGMADRMAERQRAEARHRQRMARSILPVEYVRGNANAQHLWLELPEPWRNEEFVAEARRRSVQVLPAETFIVGRGSAPHAVRLSLCTPEHRTDLERGLQTLAQVLAGPLTARLSIV